MKKNRRLRRQASAKNYSVHPAKNGGWEVKRDGAARASFRAATKPEAIARGRVLAERAKGELRLKGRDGQIRESWSYGNDPFPPAG